MNNPNLPDLQKAKGMPFGKIAKAINGFIADSKKNNVSLSRSEIILLQSLVEVLSSNAPTITPHPGPKPIEPLPPRPPHYPYDYFSYGWPGSLKKLTPKQETYNQNYPKYFSEYEVRKKECKNILLRWEEAANKNYQALNSIEHRIIKGIRKEIDQLLCSDGRWPVTRIVNWEILPPGDWPVDESSLASLFSGKSATIIPERVIAAVKLSPVEIVSGRSEFNDYLCFRFMNNTKVLLESPYEGNAAYVLRGDWETLSKKPKWELLNIYSDFCERIIHGPSGNWKYEIKRSLGLY